MRELLFKMSCKSRSCSVDNLSTILAYRSQISVIVPLKRSSFHGASFWTDESVKAVLGVQIRFVTRFVGQAREP